MSTWHQLTTYLTTGANWTGETGILNRLEQHVLFTLVAVGIAALVALPLGLTLGHLRKGGTLAINITNVGRAVPTYAVLTLLGLSSVGFGNTGTEIALILFALPPLVTNSYVGLAEVDGELRDAARGMGMSGWQMFRRVELPLATPLVMAGVRLATVQVIATATIAALVGSGGLGRLIVDGLSQQDQGQLLAGALMVALLALVAETALAAVQRRIDPLRRQRGKPPAGGDVVGAESQEDLVAA